MSNDYPIERLLRPIAEYNAATVSGVAAGLSVAAPYYWMSGPFYVVWIVDRGDS